MTLSSSHVPLTAASMELGDSVDTVGGIPCTVSRLSYSFDTTVEQIEAGVAYPTEAVATQDGRGYIAEWHQGAATRELYFETYDRRGRSSHGWIDETSRRLVQIG